MNEINLSTLSHMPATVYFCGVFGLMGLVILIFGMSGTRTDSKISIFWSTFGVLALLGFGSVAYADGNNYFKHLHSTSHSVHHTASGSH